MSKIPRLRTVSQPCDIQPVKRVPELIRVPADRTISAILLCTELTELPTHYNGTHTVICDGDGRCTLCAHRALRVYYLAGILDKHSNEVFWVQLSELAGRSLLEQARELQRPLFGLCVKISRVRKKKEAPITVEVDPYARVPDLNRKPIEPSETLERVFNSPKLNGKNRNKPV